MVTNEKGKVMGKQYAQKWKDSLSEELKFWRRWLTEDEFKRNREPRLKSMQLGIPEDLIDLSEKETLYVLDVGSGPLSTIGRSHPQYNVKLTSCDPLADEYNNLLRDVGLMDKADIINASGENLKDVFPSNTFHIVHSANALDHAYDPLVCIQNMIDVCRPGGWVYIISVENEGERQQYCGLHQWNLEIADNDVRLWNKKQDFYIKKYLKNIGEFISRPVDHHNNMPMFELKIQKKKGPVSP